MLSGQDFVSRLQEETRRTLRRTPCELRRGIPSPPETISPLRSLPSVRSNNAWDRSRALTIRSVEAVLAEALAGVSQEEARKRDEETSFLAHFAHDLRQKETQEEILNSLLDGAHRYAPRLVLFVTRGSQFVGWSSRGFSEQATQQISGYAFLHPRAIYCGALSKRMD